MAGIKSLAKDTAVYGVSSIIGRFLNWCLVPLYTIVFPVAEYGVVTFVYSVVALAMIILTYGMETGFFRFSNHERWKNPDEVYTTSLISLAVTSTLSRHRRGRLPAACFGLYGVRRQTFVRHDHGRLCRHRRLPRHTLQLSAL